MFLARRDTGTPGAGWAFTAWGGDTASTTNPLTLVVTRARSLVASFADVAAPSVSVLSPNGGEAWDIGSTHTVSWSASDNAGVDSIAVDYSRTGVGGPWIAIAHGLANTGACSWTLPSPATDSALVRITARDHALNESADASDSTFRIVDPNVGVDAGTIAFALAPPLPNPSAGGTTLRFSLPGEARVRLEILDLSGRRIAVLDREFSAGAHEWHWDGAMDAGARCGVGLYFVRMTSPFGSRLQRLVRLR